MALTGAGITDEIRANVGREGASDSGVITDARCTRWQNEAQRKIARECVDLSCLHFTNTDSIDTTQSLRYAINEISVGDNTTPDKVNRIFEVYYLDGNDSVHLTWMFPDEFDAAYPDPTHTDIAWDKPTHWTRRGANIEIFPLCACAYCDKDLRFEGDFWPEEFTTNDTTYSDICEADEGLIAYGTWQAWGAIGGRQGTIEELKWKKKFNDWLDDFKTENETVHEWGGNMYGDEIE